MTSQVSGTFRDLPCRSAAVDWILSWWGLKQGDPICLCHQQERQLRL